MAIHTALQGGALPQGHIRITAPDDFGHLLLLNELQAFGTLWPDITFEIDLSNRYVDLVREGYDLAIRAAPAAAVPGANDLITRKLLSSELYIAGSPSNSQRIASLESLSEQPISVSGRFVVHDYSSMASLIAQGAGFGLIPRMHIDHSQGALTCVLPGYSSAPSNIALVYPSRQLPRRVSLLIEHLSRRLGDS